MQVIEYLKKYSIESLKEELGVIVKEYDCGLLVLNYDQIDSPKSNPIISECRGLILDTDFNVVSRSFDRFFNYSEMPETQEHLDMTKAAVMDKIDGSLIKIYNWRNNWYVSTRGTAFAESTVNGFPDTFAQLVYKALGVSCADAFEHHCDRFLDPSCTYIFELTCMENRVVTRYDGYTLHYLACRDNQTGEYQDDMYKQVAIMFGAMPVREYTFKSIEDCVEMAKNLPNLEEGYVIYQDGKPVCKVKSPAYVAVHHIRGEGLNPKRIAQLILMNEQEEYLVYFEEDRKHFEPYEKAFEELTQEIQVVYDAHKSIEGQKEFALAVKDYPFSGVLFQARKMQQDVISTFHDQRESWKIDLLLNYGVN